MIKKTICILIILFSISQTHLLYGNSADSTKSDIKSFIGVNLNNGFILPTNDFAKSDDISIEFASLSLKYGYQTLGNNWIDYSLGLPYLGVGVNGSYFICHDELGFPITLYLFQGATLFPITNKCSFNYEWNLGMSFNWKPYDPFDNPKNIALGSSSNIYIAFIPYLKWKISSKNDLKLGMDFSHFSNGAHKKPNKGLNLYSSFLEWDYILDDLPEHSQRKENLKKNKLDSHFDYDLLLTISSRQLEFDTTGTGLASKYVDKNFAVLGVTFSPMFVSSYRYKYGLSFDLFYDESAKAKAWRQYNPADGGTYDRIKLGPFFDRFLGGMSAKGELAMPYYSIFANLGYDFIQADQSISRFYQILGVRVNLQENLFGTFGIRSTRFSRAYCIYWSLGYTFNKKD